MRKAVRATLVPLGARTPPEAPDPGPNVPMSAVSASSVRGSTSTRAYADGRVIGDTSTLGHDPQKLLPGGYTKAAAVQSSGGLKTRAAIKRPQQCLDYGTDQIRVEPPVAWVDTLATACPDKAMSTALAVLVEP